MPPVPDELSVALTSTEDVAWIVAPRSTLETEYAFEPAVLLSRPPVWIHVPLDGPVNPSDVPSSKYFVTSSVFPAGSVWTAMLSITPFELFEPKPTRPLLRPTVVPSLRTRDANVKLNDCEPR